jgi:hypothetical protein
MAKLTLNDIASGYGSTTKHNANNDLIEAAVENTLSRDGTTPNEMEANLDMNDFCILNVGCIGMGTGGTGSITNVTNITFVDDTVINSSTIFTPSYTSFQNFYETTEGNQFFTEVFQDVTNLVTWGVNNVTSATYELVATDLNKLVTFNNGGSGTTVTVPQGSTFAIGSRVDVSSLETGPVTFAGAVGVTLNGNPGLTLRAQYCGGTLVKYDTDKWLLMGDLTNA